MTLINPLFKVTGRRNLDRPIRTWKSKCSVKNTWGLHFSGIQSATWKFTSYLTPYFTPYFTPYLIFLAEVKPPAAWGLRNRNPQSKILWGSKGCSWKLKDSTNAAADKHTHTYWFFRALDIVNIFDITIVNPHISSTSARMAKSVLDVIGINSLSQAKKETLIQMTVLSIACILGKCHAALLCTVSIKHYNYVFLRL